MATQTKKAMVEERNPENLVQDEEEKVWFEWLSVERAFKKRDKDFWIIAIALLVLVSVILVFIHEFPLIIALISILFLAYVTSTVPPETVKSRLTSKGIYFGSAFYDWSVLDRFWFGKSLDNNTVNFGTKLKFPRAIIMVIEAKDQEEIKKVASRKITFVQNSPSFIDKLTRWFAERLPLEERK